MEAGEENEACALRVYFGRGLSRAFRHCRLVGHRNFATHVTCQIADSVSGPIPREQKVGPHCECVRPYPWQHAIYLIRIVLSLHVHFNRSLIPEVFMSRVFLTFLSTLFVLSVIGTFASPVLAAGAAACDVNAV